MNRQEKILKEYISEVLSTRSTLDERVVGSAKKAASGIASAVKGIFKGGTKGDTWAERQFATFKKEVGDKLSKRIDSVYNKLFDKFIPERMVNIIPSAWIGLVKSDIAGLLYSIPKENNPQKKAYVEYARSKSAISRFVRNAIETFKREIMEVVQSEMQAESIDDITRQDIERIIDQKELDKIRKEIIDEAKNTANSWMEKDETVQVIKNHKRTVLAIINELKVKEKIDEKYLKGLGQEIIKLYFQKNEKDVPYIIFAEDSDVKEVTLQICKNYIAKVKLPASKNISEAEIQKMIEKEVNKEQNTTLVKEWEQNIKEEE